MSNSITGTGVDMKLEIVVIPVSNLDRAKAFTWHATAERLRQAYRDAIDRRAGRSLT